MRKKMPEMGKSCLKWEKNQQKWRQYHPNVEKITQNEEKNCLKWEKVAPNGRKINKNGDNITHNWRKILRMRKKKLPEMGKSGPKWEKNHQN